jgi:gamma-glutamyltranspeptidase
MVVKLLNYVDWISLNSDAKQVLNILNSYGSSKAAEVNLGLHRLIEAMKHMFAVRMNLGDPAFINTAKYMSEMLSQSYADKIQKMIVDNTTFPPEYYMNMERYVYLLLIINKALLVSLSLCHDSKDSRP